MSMTLTVVIAPCMHTCVLNHQIARGTPVGIVHINYTSRKLFKPSFRISSNGVYYLQAASRGFGSLTNL